MPGRHSIKERYEFQSRPRRQCAGAEQAVHGDPHHLGAPRLLFALQGFGGGGAPEDGQFATYNFATWREVSEFRARHFRQEDDDWVRTVNSEIQVPRVIRLLSYEKLPKQTVKFNRRNIFARDNNQCQYCGRKFPTAELSLDHVIPRSQGGANTWENIVCACVSCNVRKGGRTPKQAHLSLIRKPERPKRSPLLNLKLTHRKYQSWKTFLDNAYWSVELR